MGNWRERIMTPQEFQQWINSIEDMTQEERDALEEEDYIDTRDPDIKWNERNTYGSNR